jgi:hypothetical protein
LVARKLVQFQALWRREIDGLVQFGEPFDRSMRHAVIVLQNAAHPNDRRRLILLHAHFLPDQVLRAFDSLAGVDENESMAEPPVQIHRNGGTDRALIARHQIGSERYFGDVEFPVAQKTPMPRRRVHLGQHGQIDPIGPDAALLEGAGDFVIAAGERERNWL